jgi:L-rhamnose mutarotase
MAEPNSLMIRKAFVMSVKPGLEAEHEKRHSPIWPELASTLKEQGVLSYSIFLNPGTHQLFAYVELKDEACWDALSQTPVCLRWWAYMKDIMIVNPDNSPALTTLKEVFHFCPSPI